MNTIPDVTQFSSSGSFLKALVQSQPKNLSLRGWARKLGFNSPSQLSMICNGKKPLSFSRCLNISRVLKLSPLKEKYFLSIASPTKNRTQVSSVIEREKEILTVISEPHHNLIYEWIGLPKSRTDFEEFQKFTPLRVTQDEFARCLARLEMVGLIARKNGRYFQTNSNLVSTKDNETSKSAIQSFHRKQLRLAETTLEETSHTAREYNALTVSIRRIDLPHIKEFIRDFTIQFQDRFGCEFPDSIYQLNVQLFPLDRTGRTKS